MTQDLENNNGQRLPNVITNNLAKAPKRHLNAEQDNNINNIVLIELTIPQLEWFRIVRPQILAKNFYLKPVLLQMLQLVGKFIGLSTKDPHMHLLNFVTICNLYKQHQVSKNVIRIKLYPFSLNGIAKHWINSLVPNSFTT